MLRIDGFGAEVESAVVVGYHLAAKMKNGKHYYFDLRGDQKKCEKESLAKWVERIKTTLLQDSDNWGGMEQDFSMASQDKDFVVRGLVARNGEFLTRLSADKSEYVRQEVLKHLINKRENGEKLENIRFLNSLVEDKSISVRLLLARLGVQSHLSKLVEDEEVAVVCEAAKTCSSEALDSLIDSKDIHICLAASNNPNVSLEQMSALLGGRFRMELDNLIKNGEVGLEISNHQSYIVRRAFAQHGEKEQIALLVNDEDAGVREWLATRGVATKILLRDPDKRVRYAAQSSAMSGVVCK